MPILSGSPTGPRGTGSSSPGTPTPRWWTSGMPRSTWQGGDSLIPRPTGGPRGVAGGELPRAEARPRGCRGGAEAVEVSGEGPAPGQVRRGRAAGDHLLRQPGRCGPDGLLQSGGGEGADRQRGDGGGVQGDRQAAA